MAVMSTRPNRFHPNLLTARLALRVRACLTLASVDYASVARYDTYVFMLLLSMAGSAVAAYRKVNNTQHGRKHIILDTYNVSRMNLLARHTTIGGAGLDRTTRPMRPPMVCDIYTVALRLVVRPAPGDRHTSVRDLRWGPTFFTHYRWATAFEHCQLTRCRSLGAFPDQRPGASPKHWSAGAQRHCLPRRPFRLVARSSSVLRRSPQKACFAQRPCPGPLSASSRQEEQPSPSASYRMREPASTCDTTRYRLSHTRGSNRHSQSIFATRGRTMLVYSALCW